jgi:hypothetical protein
MAETIPQFDSLAQGLGYASVPTPTSDADPGQVSNYHEKDSTNDTPTCTPMSIPTTSAPAPGHGALLLTNFQPIDHQDRTKPHYDPDRS